jgi:hypothetical protein
MDSKLGLVVLWIAVVAMGCAGDAPSSNNQASPSDPASCEALVDHRISECPGQVARLRDIETCEDLRATVAPIGCTQAFADYVHCETHADIDCVSGEPLGCSDEQMKVQRCRQLFAQRTSCTRGPARSDGVCAGSTRRFNFSCIDLRTLGPLPTPPNCEVLRAPFDLCCSSFSNDTLDESIFVDPVLGPDELPPDNSAIDFTNPTMCLDFSEAQGWGRCPESSGCACANCAPELTTCAANYGCLLSQRCDRGDNCSPAPDDPFSTGWGNSDPVVACMEAAGCAESCN